MLSTKEELYLYLEKISRGYALKDLKYFTALRNTFILSLISALIQTFICCLIGYGFAKFKFPGSKILFALVLFTMIVPHSTLQLALFMKFKNFDIYGILNLLGGGVFSGLDIIPGNATYIDFTNSPWPLVILSLGGIGFKNGLYILQWEFQCLSLLWSAIIRPFPQRLRNRLISMVQVFSEHFSV